MNPENEQDRNNEKGSKIALLLVQNLSSAYHLIPPGISGNTFLPKSLLISENQRANLVGGAPSNQICPPAPFAVFQQGERENPGLKKLLFWVAYSSPWVSRATGRA